ncbi:hypothetical protein [Actinoalloteichus hymeniacidonis]|uniref:Uncharacterized protein n=1 Tax=Actinoalloteichus hymeniacidonis TaxID=340345 RepID=A0AAC9HTU7_9PSEU|nr:hypothetical protein [Actinoalloteichus hymeniacidonis]AOS65006.1 hypothetical protein TL08_21080 [Actinoalloteichus hymeniacidonis]MBB5906917.1 hypothetical protein [Actinoalloteichus hymeniacidonis]
MAENRLGEPEFFSTSSIKEYCTKGRDLLRPLHHELAVSAEEMQVVLTYVPGVDSRVRARLVAAHLRRASAAVEVANLEIVRTFLSFQRHFTQELSQAKRTPRRKFEFDE